MLYRFSRGWKVKLYMLITVALFICVLLLLILSNNKMIFLKVIAVLLFTLSFMWTSVMGWSNFYYKRRLRGDIHMSKETKYLNYSRGLFLKKMCETIMKEIEGEKGLSHMTALIGYERRNLRKNQSSLWECTVSDLCYYDYLGKIADAINDNATVEAIDAIYQEIKKITRSKIYVLFLMQEPACWPSIESVYYAAKNNPDFETALVYTPFFHKDNLVQTDYYDFYADEMNLPVIRCKDYNLPQYSPDLVFMIKPYGNVPEQFEIKHLQCVIPRVVYIPYGMELTTDLAKFGFQYYLHYKAWRHCAYGNIVKEYAKKYGYRNGENVAVWGHPKADHYIDMAKNKENIPQDWKTLINGRKTILWTPHHLIGLDGKGTGTWLIWGEKILKLIQQNEDIVFIFRPHPLMMGALVNNDFMTEQEVESLQNRIKNISNIIWDTNASYYNAFDAADAIITDGTTFSFEFLYTKKPILLTPRNMNAFYQHDKMQESYYIVEEEKDIENFIDMIRKSEDPLYEKRMEFYRNTFFIPENGTVGENIMKNVKGDLTKECQILDEELLESGKSTSLIEMISDDCVKCEDNTIEQKLPLFSIVVLCYKNTKLLYGMLDTIFAQDYPRIELIVSDDGSEDFDKDEIERYVQCKARYNIEKVLVLKNEKNIGTVKHVHSVLQRVSGEFVVLTAADDRFSCSDAITAYVEGFVDSKAMWIVAKCDLTSPDYKKKAYTTPTQADKPYFEEGDAQKLFSRWSRRGMAIPCHMAYRKKAIEAVGGIDLDYKYLEDWPLTLKLLRNGFAPLFLDKIVAVHSMGGITNSNARYGVELRKAFYQDKYLIFKKEVEPYKKMLSPEDKKAYKQYRKEILERHYFFNIDCQEKTKKQLFFHMLRKPIRFWWLFENKYMNRMNGKIPRKKLILTSHALLLFAFFFLQFQGVDTMKAVFWALGSIDVIAAIIILFGSISTVFIEKHFRKKAQLRKNLVN